MHKRRSEFIERQILRERLHDRYPDKYEVVEAVVCMLRGNCRAETELLLRDANVDELIAYLERVVTHSGMGNLIEHIEHFWSDHHQHDQGTVMGTEIEATTDCSSHNSLAIR